MNEQLNKIFNESTKMPIMVGVVSFAAGVGVTLGVSYIRNRKNTRVELSEERPHRIPRPGASNDELETFIAAEKKRLGIGVEHEDKPEPEPEPEVEDEGIKEPGDELSQPDPSEVGKQFVEQKLEESTTLETTPETYEPSGIRSHNVFAESDDDWDYEKEQLTRSSNAPYILHRDEFHADELNYAQITLTYFAGDDILVDEEEVPIYNHHQTIGPINFGHGSGYPNVFYVRNDKRRAEYEILRDSGMYSKEVLGLDIENNARSKDLKHSHHVPRFNIDD